MRWMFPVIGMFAAFLFFRGHDLPGGGFAAGIAMSIGFILNIWRAARAGWRSGCASIPCAG